MTATPTANAGSSSPGREGTGWRAALRRTVREFREDGLLDWAAALTYYGVLSLFPGLLVLVSLLGVMGGDATRPLVDTVAGLAPGPARDLLLGAIEELEQSRSTSGTLLVVALVGAIWSASSYVGAFMRASNAIYDVDEGRPVWKTVPLRLVTTLLLLVMAAAVAVAVTLTGGLARAAGDLLGVEDSAVTAWDAAKWPVIFCVVVTMFALLYWLPPNVRHPFRWLSPGALLGVALWLAASVGFALYVSHFGSYNKTYGALAGVVVFLVWLWLTNIAVLLGAELNAELERGEQIEAGLPEGTEPFLEPRDTRRLRSEPASR